MRSSILKFFMGLSRFAIAAAFVVSVFPPPGFASSTRYGRIPDFKLVERSGAPFTRSDLAGQVWIADFVFTRCQELCPLLSAKMAALQNELADSGVKLVSFSVDPEYDQPLILKNYADRFGAKEGSWFFLTGERETMESLVTVGFHLGVAQATEEDLKEGVELVMHSRRFVLVDREGDIRGYYDTSEPVQLDELRRDALELAAGGPEWN